MGRLTDSELDTLYARILITCRNNPAVLQAAGTHALVVEHTAAGLRFWREVLPGRVQARAAPRRPGGTPYLPEQMMEIFPQILGFGSILPSGSIEPKNRMWLS